MKKVETTPVIGNFLAFQCANSWKNCDFDVLLEYVAEISELCPFGVQRPGSETDYSFEKEEFIK